MYQLNNHSYLYISQVNGVALEHCIENTASTGKLKSDIVIRKRYIKTFNLFYNELIGFFMLPIFTRLLALYSIIFLVGCASSLPDAKEMQAQLKDYTLPKTPEKGKALVYVVRPSGIATLIRFNVFVDSKEDASEVGYTRGRQYIYFPVKPGTHTIYSKAENWAESQISAKEGDTIFLQQNPALGIVISRNNLEPIDALDGTYRVKDLSLGTIHPASQQ
jgi:hypothetical protein